MRWDKFIWTLLDVADKYYLIAAPAFLLFYILLRKKITYKKIQRRFPRLKDYGREIFFSTVSIIIFTFPPLFLLFNHHLRQHTTFYSDIRQYGLAYTILAFPIMLVIHDTYFYWIHRLMHHPRLFRLFHLVHHRSNNPSPWAAYAFHPLEAVLESLIFVIFLFTIPVSALHLNFFFIFSLVYNVYGHLGFELYPRNFSTHWFGKWMNTSVAHNMHHQYFEGNYGLYFTIWDRAMGTLREEYDEKYNEVTSRGKTKLHGSSQLRRSLLDSSRS
jgi:Delta7-sterol 5-desaturase